MTALPEKPKEVRILIRDMKAQIIKIMSKNK